METRNSKTTILTFFLFLNLYIALTFFWKLSENFYESLELGTILKSSAPFLASLLIVIRHAQLIEVTFNLSKQNEYSLGILGLTLPIISTLLQPDLTIEITGLLLTALVVFEFFLLRQRSLWWFILCKGGLAVAWVAVFLALRKDMYITTKILETTQLTVIYYTFSVIFFAEIFHTCKSMPATFRDRYDLYMLAYFSVAGVLFNYCSEHLANNRLRDIIGNSMGASDALLFVFWVVVLVRIVQSLHLAALDYHDTQIRGLDLFILSVFYVFITVYRVLDKDNVSLYFMLFVLSSVAAGYFLYMRLVRIRHENSISIRHDMRIQTVNTITFSIVAISNVIMMFNGYNEYLLLLQLLMLLFNIFHSYRLTMWVKFDLLQRVHDDSLSFIPVQRSEVRKVAAIVNRNFGYVYAYAIGKPNHRKDSLKLVYALLSSGSIFSWFGSSHYYWIYDKLQNRNVGLACLKTQHNYCFAYTTFSAIAFVIRYLSITSIRAGLTNIHALIQNAHYLKRLDLSSQFGVEVTYLVIHPNKRRLGYARKVMEALLQAKIYSKSLYPLKNTPLEHVDILVRETNEPALTFFSNLGFQLRAKIQDARFDSETNAGGAFVMRHSMFSARNGV